MDRLLDHRGLRLFMWAMAAFYAYGASIHVMNIAGMSGFDWTGAPLKWQVLDIVYLALDVTIVWGAVRRAGYALPLLAVAALSQIGLYTAGRGWVLDVPPDYRPPAGAESYLDGLVAFHVVTLVVMSALIALALRRPSPPA